MSVIQSLAKSAPTPPSSIPRHSPGAYGAAMGLGRASVVPSLANAAQLDLMRGLSSVFRPAAEIFIASIMVIDVFALWLPRVLGALFRGADKPKAPKDASTLTKATTYLKGLNWNNAWEETWREVCSGPALFFWPTILFSMARKGFGGRAVELKQPVLESLTERYSELTPSKGSKAKALDAGWHKLLPKVFTELETAPKEFKTFMDGWFKKFSQLLSEQPIGSKNKEYVRKLEQHEKALMDKVLDLNRTHNPKKRFYKYDHILASFGDKPSLKPVSEVFNTLVNFRDLVRTAKRKTAHESAALKPLLKGVYHRILRAKALYSVLSVGITLAFLSRLVFWAQKNNNYPANRHVPLGGQKSASGVAGGFKQWAKAPLIIPNFKEWAR